MHTHRVSLVASGFALALLSLPLGASASAQQGDPPAVPAPPPTKAENDRTSILLRIPKPNAAGFVGDPYPLDVCIVTGETLGKDAVTLILKDQTDPLQEGRHLRFASEAARQLFLSRPAEYLTKLDAEIIHRTAASYPIDRDVVEIDRMLTERFPFVYGNRCYVVMRPKNIDNFLKQSGRYVGVYDKLITTKQRSRYPLDTSIVTGEKLPEKPYDIVIGSTLFRLGSEAEAKTVLEDAATYLAKMPPLKSAATTTPAEGTTPAHGASK